MTEVDPLIQAFAKKLVLDTEAEVLQKIRVRAAAGCGFFFASEVGPNIWVYNSHFTMVYGTYNYSIHGVYKPTYKWVCLKMGYTPNEIAI